MDEKTYREGLILAMVMKKCIDESLIVENGLQSLEEWKRAMDAKKMIEDLGYPVSYNISTFQDWASERSVCFVSVLLYRIPKDASPSERAKFDRWFERRTGIKEEEFPSGKDPKAGPKDPKNPDKK